MTSPRRATPSVSVALATFNASPYLQEQLASIGTQTHLPDEIVVGDDGSNDGTAEVVSVFARAHPEIAVRFLTNLQRLGTTGNFESIVRRCRGDIVVFCDQDDVWLPTRLERISIALQADPDALYLFSDATLIDSAGSHLDGTLFSSVLFDRSERRNYAAGNGLEVLLRHNVVTGATLAVRRRVLDELLPFERGWVHDYFIAFVLEAIGRGVMVEEPLIQYRVHARQQVGVANRRLRALIDNARRQSAAACSREAENFRALRVRLAALDGLRHHSILAELERKAAFVDSRATMRTHPLRAPVTMWREWRRSNYQRYALGWKQLLVDTLAVALARGGGPPAVQERTDRLDDTDG